MRKIVSIFVIMLLALSSCTNLEDMYRRLDDYESRLKRLEEMSTKANATMAIMQKLLDAQANKVGIVSYTPTKDGKGYVLSMSDGSTITLTNGENGLTPNIGFAQDVDGLLYWTLNGQFMLDAHGKKIKAEARDGVSPQTPKMRVNTDGNWEISNDGGKTWSEIKDANGKPVSANGAAKVDLTITKDKNGNIVIKYNGETFVIGKDAGGTTPPDDGGGTTPKTGTLKLTDATKASEIMLNITPSDNNLTYFWSALKKSDYDKKLENPLYPNIFEFDKSWFKMQTEGTDKTWIDAMMKFVLTGPKTVNVLEEVFVIIDDTEYMCWAYGIDAKSNLTTEITTKLVKTPKSVPTGNTFTVKENKRLPNGIDAQITPSVKNDPYYVSLQTAKYVQWWLDNSSTRDMAYSLLKDLILSKGKISDFTFTGDAHITPDNVSASRANTDYYVIMFSYSPENGVGSKVELYPFKTAPSEEE